MPIETATEVITPATAARYLEVNDCNRPMSLRQRDRLARDMLAGSFRHTHQGIAFDTNGRLFDGQHRLSAIVASGKAQTMQVTRNVPVECRSMVDVQARARSVSDSLAMDAYPINSKEAVAICRMWSSLLGCPSLTVHEVKEFLQQHSEAILFAIEMGGGNAILRHACVAAMVAVGCEAGHKEAIAQWCEVIRNGVTSELWHTSAIRFRDWWLLNKHNGGATDRYEYCRRIYSSMLAWVERRGLTKLYANKSIEWV